MSDWKGNEDDLPKFGDRAQKWFRLSVRQRVNDRLSRDKKRGYTEIARDRIAAIVNEVCAHPFRYVYCLPKMEYSGSAYGYYSWEIALEVLDNVLSKLMDGAREAAENEEFANAVPTLDAWLRADIEDSLPRRFRTHASGSELLPSRIRSELTAAARERRRTWPIVCRSCGESFTKKPRSRGRPLYCAKCSPAHAG